MANAVAFFWYPKEHYDRMRMRMTDRHNLPLTYESWIAQAEVHCKAAEARGHVVIRVQADPDVFFPWCLAENIDCNAKARLDFAVKHATGVIPPRTTPPPA